MQKFIGTLAALSTLAVQVFLLSEMASQKQPPPLLQKALEIPQEVSTYIEKKIDEDEISSIPENYFYKGVYAFHNSPLEAWKLWGIISLALSIVVFLGTWIYETVSWGFLDIDDAITAIGASIGTFIVLIVLKTLWLIGRWGYQIFFS